MKLHKPKEPVYGVIDGEQGFTFSARMVDSEFNTLEEAFKEAQGLIEFGSQKVEIVHALHCDDYCWFAHPSKESIVINAGDDSWADNE